MNPITALLLSFVLVMNAHSNDDAPKMCRDLSVLCQKIESKSTQSLQSSSGDVTIMCRNLSALCQKIDNKSVQSSQPFVRPLPKLPISFTRGPLNQPFVYKAQDKLQVQNFLKENQDAFLRMNDLSYNFVKGSLLRTKEEEGAINPKDLAKIRQKEKTLNQYYLSESTKEMEQLKSEGWEIKGINGLEGKYNEYPDLSGFVAYNRNKNIMVVAYHGTTNKAAWSNNFDAMKMQSFDLRRVYIKDFFTYMTNEIDRNIDDLQAKRNATSNKETINRTIATLSDLKALLNQRRSTEAGMSIDSIRYIGKWIEDRNAQTSERTLKDILGELNRYCHIKEDLIKSVDAIKVNIVGQVHSGFLKKYSSSKEELIKTMKFWIDPLSPELKNSIRIVFIGHSQAGGLGMLALADIGANHGQELLGQDFDNTKMNNFGAYLLSVARAGDDQFRDWLHQKIGKENILRQNVHGDLVPIAGADQKLMKTIKKLPVLGTLFEEMGGLANDVGFFLFDDPIDAWHRAKDYYVKVVGRNPLQYDLLDNALRLILGNSFASIILEPQKSKLTSQLKNKAVGTVGLGGLGITLARIVAGNEKAGHDLKKLLTERFSHLHYLLRIKEIEGTHFSTLIPNKDLNGMLAQGLRHQQNKIGK